MKRHALTRRLIACQLALIGLGTLAAPAPAAQDVSVSEWSRQVWESASRGDMLELARYLENIPDADRSQAARDLQVAVDTHNRNFEAARQDRAEAEAEARGRLQEALDEGEISQALTAAVEVQTLSQDEKAVVEDELIGRVVDAARAGIPTACDNGDWLLAYELAYRLNVLFEHTGEYEAELNRINRRLAMLTYYAPRTLHDLRARQAERFGEEPLGEFNAALTEDWEQRVDEINHRMVKRAMETAAEHHIEAQGWRPLLRGALEGLRMLATTPALTETFPSLHDEEKVRRWLEFIDARQAQLAQTPDSDLGYWYCARLLDKVVDESEGTIGLPKQVLYREFGDGAMYELDQFSEIIWPNKLRRFRQSTHGSFVGVGILIRHDDKREIMVVSPLEGTPAYFAGIKPDDRIVSVDDASTAGWSLNDAVDKITGRKGSEVEIGVRREGVEGVLTYSIKRDVIKIRSVKGWWKEGLEDDGTPIWSWYIDPETRIGYVRLTAFNEDTFEDLKTAWMDMLDAGKPNGLIVDLRYNPGGLLTAAVEVSNLFVRDGVIVSGETKDGTKAWPDRRAEPNKALVASEGVPTVILVNQGSASASEIVAGCLQAHGEAIVVGRRSYGKGSVQTVHPISRSNALLKLTTQYYRLPPSAEQRALGHKGDLVHKRPGAERWGVEPDIVVNTTPEEIKAAYDLRQAADIIAAAGQPVEERPDVNALVTEGLDPQLETALLILQARALETTARETRHAMAR